MQELVIEQQLQVSHVRMQEPILYARSVRRNILYGLEEEDGGSPGDVPSADDVEQAARLANAHSFIIGWPQGYETVCSS